LKKASPKKPLFKTHYRENMRVWGEDVYFCRQVKEQGFKVYVDTGLLCGHYGGIIPEGAFKGYIY